MFKELKKQTVKKAFIVAFTLFLIALIPLFVEWDVWMTMNKEVQVFERLTPEEIEAYTPVEISLKENFGCFMEEYQRYKYSTRTTTTDLYYIIWTGDDDAVDYRYMAIKVPVGRQAEMDAMAERFYYGESSEPIHFTGIIKQMSAQDKKYFYEYFEAAEFTQSEMDEMTLPYYIEVKNLESDKKFATWMAIASGVVIGIGVLYVVLMLSGFGLRKIKKEILNSGYGEEEVQEDFESSECLCQVPTINVGNKFLYFYTDMVPHAIMKKSVVWMYYKEINKGRRSKDFLVVICTDEGKRYQLSALNKAYAQSAIDKLEKRLPWILIGYTKSLDKVYKSDLDTFLNYRYNKVEKNV